MMRSMFSAVSGLSAHQLRMDVIGNNIANVNTVGFKGSRVTFQEVFSQTLSGASSPQNGRGGTNPQQVGLGISVASMDTFHVRGATETTGYNTDLMINGDGFFIVSNDANFLNHSYTRAGMFAIDEMGNLVTPDGYRVLGHVADAEGNLGAGLEGIVISKSQTAPALSTGEVGGEAPNYVGVSFEGNLNSDTTTYEGDPLDLEDVLVDDIRDYVARETTFKAYDELGGTYDVNVAFVKTAPNQYDVWTVQNGALAEKLDVGSEGSLNFSDGKINDEARAAVTIVPPGFDGNINDDTLMPNGARAFTFTVDFSKLTQYDNTSTASAGHVRGYKQGVLEDFTISPSGEIMGIFDNGQRRLLGQVALANFRNPAGLEKTGSNMYRTTANSGQALVGTPGAGGFANLQPGALEMSNVDLSREFTNMITTQRGFQANSRIISTSDEMLQEVVNMKR